MQANKLYILLIAITITVIVMLWDSSEEILTPPRARSDVQDFPYAVAERASTHHFDDSGIVDYAFTAAVLEHYRTESTNSEKEAEEYTLMTTPHFILYEQSDEKTPDHDKQPWHIQAELGRLERTSENITLWNDVRIWQTARFNEEMPDQKQPQKRMSSTLDLQTSELSTSFLTIDAHKKVARTDKPVKIRSAYGTIDAVGMTADFSKRNIKLHQRVQATHKIPPQAK